MKGTFKKDFNNNEVTYYFEYGNNSNGKLPYKVTKEVNNHGIEVIRDRYFDTFENMVKIDN